MSLKQIYFKGYRCFRTHFAGFEELCPVNVLIGQNNSGKSHLLELVRTTCENKFKNRGCVYRITTEVSPNALKKAVSLPVHHPLIKKMSGKTATWDLDNSGQVVEVWDDDGRRMFNPENKRKYSNHISALLRETMSGPLIGTKFVHLSADRDIRRERATDGLALTPFGEGATNIVRRYLTSSSPDLPHQLIQEDLLGALNHVFSVSGQFTNIQIRVHDDSDSGIESAPWEIFLEEDGKGYIPLSASGSGLKTILLVLLNLLVVPKTKGYSGTALTYAFEELENNLHPGILRRLLSYIEDYAIKNEVYIFITTHSSVALDTFALSNHAQIIHVKHDGESASTSTVGAHFDRVGLVSELGAKPSDLMQANCVIWVEGPSDAVYLNKWIDLMSEGRFVEGRHYQCVFYSGSLLARLSFGDPEGEMEELLNLMTVNNNVIVVADSDKLSKYANLKPRVRRIRDELKEVPGSHMWITQPKEIENYLPAHDIAQFFGKDKVKWPEMYEPFFPMKEAGKASYLERAIGRKSVDKMELALATSKTMILGRMKKRFDWERQLKTICTRIERWNS